MVCGIQPGKLCNLTLLLVARPRGFSFVNTCFKLKKNETKDLTKINYEIT